MDSMPNLGLGRDSYVFAVYHPCWLITTPGVLMSGNINVGVIFSGSKGRCLNDPQIDRDSESGLENRCYRHIFRDIDVFSAFPLAALLGATMGKALKMSISLEKYDR